MHYQYHYQILIFVKNIFWFDYYISLYFIIM